MTYEYVPFWAFSELELSRTLQLDFPYHGLIDHGCLLQESERILDAPALDAGHIIFFFILTQIQTQPIAFNQTAFRTLQKFLLKWGKL
jgi:hypothetical protein